MAITELLRVDPPEPRRHKPATADVPKPSENADTRRGPKLYSAAGFLASCKPVESIVDGLPIPRGGVSCLTGLPGHGKTTIATALEVALVTGRPFAGREVTRGAVVVMAGENADDYAGHLRATLQHMGLDAADLRDYRADTDLLVIPGVFALEEMEDVISDSLGVTGVFTLVAVIVDSSAAYFAGVDENDNAQSLDHARRLRSLTTLQGNPAVIALCHPTKNAPHDNLVPRGGGAFLAEVDANLTVWNDSGTSTLSWCRKIRGSPFEPIPFELRALELRDVADSRGRPISSTVAVHVSGERAEQIETAAITNEGLLLVALLRSPGATFAKLALACGWTHGMGTPTKSRVADVMRKLEAQKLVDKDRRSGGRKLTQAGRREAEGLVRC